MPFSTTTSPILQLSSVTTSEDSARDFLISEGILRPNINCATCSCPMVRKPCSRTKSMDLQHWTCSPCRRSVTIREGSVLKGKKISCADFISLLFWFSTPGLSGSTISEFTQLGEDTVSIYRRIITDEATFWFIDNAKPIGGVGKHVEIDEAKFRRMKHHRGRARAEEWVLGGVERESGRCFIVPCPNGKRTKAVLLPIIQRWVLPGTTIYTDGWKAYQSIPAITGGYSHSWVNHTLYFKDPVTGVHTNRQEGLWKHIRASVTGSRTLEDSFVEFMLRKEFTSGGNTRGRDRTVLTFNGYLTILRA